MIFKTEHLILRPWEEGDAESLYSFASNPKIGPIAGWPPHESVEDSLNIIKTVFAKKENCPKLKISTLGNCHFALTTVIPNRPMCLKELSFRT